MRTLGAVQKDELCHVLSWGSSDAGRWPVFHVRGRRVVCLGSVRRDTRPRGFLSPWVSLRQHQMPEGPRGDTSCTVRGEGAPCLPGLLCGLRGQQDTFRQRPFIVPRKAGATVCARAEHALQLSPPYTVPTLRLLPACPLQPPGGTTLPLRGRQKPLRPSRPCGRKWPSAVLASRWRAARAPMSAGSAPPPSRALPPVSPT